MRCPTCGSEDVTYLATQKRYKCYQKHPRAQFSLKVGTVFEDSPIGLEKWLPALWLLVNCKNGISSYELARALGVTQKSAWFMLARLRLALHLDDDQTKFTGILEADETYIGGAARFMHKAKHKRVIRQKVGAKGGNTNGKIAVMGLLARHGKSGHSEVRTFIVPNVRRHHLDNNIRKHVELGSDATIMTDALKSYEHLNTSFEHKVIDHAERYVNGVIHTNSMENFWSLLKRAIKGTYVSIEPFHLFRYLDEQAHRFNTRKLSDAARFAMSLQGIIGKRLTYGALTGSELPQT